jgi:hypothetical protein
MMCPSNTSLNLPTLYDPYAPDYGGRNVGFLSNVYQRPNLQCLSASNVYFDVYFDGNDFEINANEFQTKA